MQKIAAAQHQHSECNKRRLNSTGAATSRFRRVTEQSHAKIKLKLWHASQGPHWGSGWGLRWRGWGQDDAARADWEHNGCSLVVGVPNGVHHIEDGTGNESRKYKGATQQQVPSL
jgi:hypothetical protein